MSPYLIAAAALLTPALVLAQDTAPVPSPDSLQALALALITAATPMVIALVKWAAPKIPSVYLPFAAPLVGMLVEMLAHVATGVGVAPLVAAFAGLAGVGAREATDQLRKRIAPPATE